ncbi:MarR family winged helix-turn-helix transcriptional regulator [Defluviitalea phaphyphila]|uniref:MarR family winged helix-turn-helix transcriptional regulator n=1 Tax=Defluviitalea phaphyphila TaxID=1473580 RepID=UPI0007315EEF|nr:MarR family transcriptional regulator [Defluviitalea phaphyphila]
MNEQLIKSLTQIIINISQNKDKLLNEKKLKYKMTFNEMRVMEIIGTSKNPKKMKDIAKIMGMTKGGITFLIDKLEKKGLVKRQKNEVDRRVLYIELTKKGERFFTEYSKNKYDILYKWVENMNPSNKQVVMEEFNRALEIVEQSV